jgi:hypothetical protein
VATIRSIEYLGCAEVIDLLNVRVSSIVDREISKQETKWPLEIFISFILIIRFKSITISHSYIQILIKITYQFI